MKKIQVVLGIILILVMTGTPGHAAAPPGAPSEEATKVKEDDRLPIHQQEKWQFFVSPYIWIPGVNMTTTSLRKDVNTNVPWWDTAAALFSKTIGVMGRAEAWKGRWGLYVDGYFTYLGFSDSQVGATRHKSFGPVDFTLDKQVHLDGVSLNLGIPGQVSGNVTLTPSGSVKYIGRVGSLDLGGRFLVGTRPLTAGKPLPVLSLELLGGLRFNSINQYLRINLRDIKIGNTSIDIHRFSLSGNHQSIKGGSLVVDYTLQFFEPFLGARLGLWLTPKWLVSLKGDVGGFGFVVNNNVTCNLEALLGYRFHKNVYAYGGYKARGSWYDLGEDLAQINFSGWFHGPVMGMTFTF
uniref:Uncharacterized protein n=1 Tax=Desulfobacca acetoxidans TaxID=60893 RepID=A0A7C3UXS5_9BACT